MNVFKAFEQDDIVKANPTEVSTGLWSGDTGSLTAFYTSSTQSGSTSGQYYYDVYNFNPQLTASAEVQFSIAYGNVDGYGAATLNDDDNALLPTKATYFQYRNILLEPDDPTFTFLPTTAGATYNADEIFVVNVRRQRLREKLDPGNWSMKLNGATYIDDSGQTLGATYGKAGRVFNIVSGSLTGVSGSTVVATSSISGGFGLMYPDIGILVFNVQALRTNGSISATDLGTGAGNRDNNWVFLTALQSGSDFQARSAENISSTHYFVRMRNKEYNYSNNPSFFDETNGNIINTDFIQDPQVYVTTVGLYNASNELVAVAKLSQPLRKSFDREALVRVRLDF